MDKATVLQNVESEFQNLQKAVEGLDNEQMAKPWLWWGKTVRGRPRSLKLQQD